jgi:hypothetical protein
MNKDEKTGFHKLNEKVRTELANIKEENVQLKNEMKRVYEKAVEDQKLLRKEMDGLKKQTEEDVMRLGKELNEMRVAAAEAEVEMFEFKQKDMEEKMTLCGTADYILKNFDIVAQTAVAQEEHSEKAELNWFF